MHDYRPATVRGCHSFKRLRNRYPARLIVSMSLRRFRQVTIDKHAGKRSVALWLQRGRASNLAAMAWPSNDHSLETKNTNHAHPNERPTMQTYTSKRLNLQAPPSPRDSTMPSSNSIMPSSNSTTTAGARAGHRSVRMAINNPTVLTPLADLPKVPHNCTHTPTTPSRTQPWLMPSRVHQRSSCPHRPARGCA
jgi:hypothetical protein